jgi:hypothetical protein
MPGVDQQDLYLLGLAQGVEDRLPIHPGRLHRDVCDAFLHQPGHHLPQHRVERLVLADLLAALPGDVAGHADGHRDLPLAHIEPRDPRINNFHGNSSSTNPPNRQDTPPAESAKKSRV